DLALLDRLLDEPARRAVAVAVHFGELEELAGLLARLEAVLALEEVIAPVLFARPDRARRGRDRTHRVVARLEQVRAERRLAHTARPRNHHEEAAADEPGGLATRHSRPA